MIDTYYKRNVIGISGCEFLWGLGLPVVLESTFLQLFLKSLGASSFQIGLIPAFSFLGSSVFRHCFPVISQWAWRSSVGLSYTCT